jgi:hypothetical protein
VYVYVLTAIKNYIMDYLNYAAEFQPMSVLPSDKLSIDEELATIPVPTVRLDTKRALPSK